MTHAPMIVRSVTRQSTAYVCWRPGSIEAQVSALNVQSAPALTALQQSWVIVQRSHVAGGMPPVPALPPPVEDPPALVVPPLVADPPDEVEPPVAPVVPPVPGGWWRKCGARSASAVT